jgi:hypothetical protein
MSSSFEALHEQTRPLRLLREDAEQDRSAPPARPAGSVPRVRRYRMRRVAAALATSLRRLQVLGG